MLPCIMSRVALSVVCLRRGRKPLLTPRRSVNGLKPAEAAAAAADDDSDVKRGRKRRSRNNRNRAPPESPDKQFFAELRYDDYDSATVVTCTIIDKSAPHGFKTKCEFCPASFGILHPGDGKYVCGKRNQRDEFFLLRNRLLTVLTPYTWPKKEDEKE